MSLSTVKAFKFWNILYECIFVKDKNARSDAVKKMLKIKKIESLSKIVTKHSVQHYVFICTFIRFKWNTEI